MISYSIYTYLHTCTLGFCVCVQPCKTRPSFLVRCGGVEQEEWTAHSARCADRGDGHIHPWPVGTGRVSVRVAHSISILIKGRPHLSMYVECPDREPPRAAVGVDGGREPRPNKVACDRWRITTHGAGTLHTMYTHMYDVCADCRFRTTGHECSAMTPRNNPHIVKASIHSQNLRLFRAVPQPFQKSVCQLSSPFRRREKNSQQRGNTWQPPFGGSAVREKRWTVAYIGDPPPAGDSASMLKSSMNRTGGRT